MELGDIVQYKEYGIGRIEGFDMDYDYLIYFFKENDHQYVLAKNLETVLTLRSLVRRRQHG